MNKSRFGAVSLLVIFALVLLAVVETLWAVRTYREMREGYKQQIRSVLEEAAWKYATNSMNGSANISIGNISRFDAFVGEGLRTSGIATKYRVEVLSTTDAEPILLMAMGEEQVGEESLSVDKYLTPLILRLTVEDPQAAILRSMRWILSLQLLSVVVLALTFIYLLHTLFRAKSLEEMRRDLTHNITHELKTPIAAAYAATDVLLSTPEIASNASRRDEYLRMTRDALGRLGAMVEEILRSSTEEFASAELRLEECSIGEIVEEQRAAIAMKYAMRSIAWHINIAEDMVVVADRFYLAGVISSLLDNAVKYSPHIVEITVEAATRGGRSYISVEDRGVGIERRARRRIFDKFYRVGSGNRHDTKGYGLGLYYVKSVVKRHGGSVELRSKIGVGSRFTITLPRYGR